MRFQNVGLAEHAGHVLFGAMVKMESKFSCGSKEALVVDARRAEEWPFLWFGPGYDSSNFQHSIVAPVGCVSLILLSEGDGGRHYLYNAGSVDGRVVEMDGSRRGVLLPSTMESRNRAVLALLSREKFTGNRECAEFLGLDFDYF